jgi:hypothetical protein
MTRPPSGMPPPTSATLDGAVIELMPLAEVVADRYFDEFPEDLERYGDVVSDEQLATVLCAAAVSVRGYSPGD